MDKKVFEKEELYLKDTINLINSKLNILAKNSENNENTFSAENTEYLDYLYHNVNKFNDDDYVEIVNMQNKLTDIENYQHNLDRDRLIFQKMLDKPYFASIDIQEANEDREVYYIGINSLLDDNKHFQVIDWRSQVASIFYDYEQGKCSIITNNIKTEYELFNKRQFGIHDGKLDYYIDTNINIEDAILQEVLAKNTTNKMKSIIQTIQKEQNEIIRADDQTTLIVQGVAGSGKTAIALHRIAYLLYKYNGRLKSNNIVFLTPNNAFATYISSVLPELAEDDVEKMQLDTLARNYLKHHCIIEKKYEQIERIIESKDTSEYNYKTSIKFLEDIIDFANKNYIDNYNISDIRIYDTIIDSNKIKDLFFNKYSEFDIHTRLRWITDNIFDIYFYEMTGNDRVARIKQFIFKKLYDAIDNKNCVKAYINFLNSKSLNLELIGNKVKNEDAYGILFMKMFIFGLHKFENIKHLVIDEFQDYSPIQMYIINNIFPCSKTILGDYYQAIDVKKSKNNLELSNSILNGDKKIVNINKSYRSTEEIASFYNSLSDSKSMVVSRHGENVDITEINKLSDIVRIINEYTDKGYNSIAVITKTGRLAKSLHGKLQKLIKSIRLIDTNLDEYNNDICVISAFNSKGLEFDGVIVYNVSEKEYNNDFDKNLLYIASTRALHKLTITYNGKLTKFIIN